jgi:hypothetical protein
VVEVGFGVEAQGKVGAVVNQQPLNPGARQISSCHSTHDPTIGVAEVGACPDSDGGSSAATAVMAGHSGLKSGRPRPVNARPARCG